MCSFPRSEILVTVREPVVLRRSSEGLFHFSFLLPRGKENDLLQIWHEAMIFPSCRVKPNRNFVCHGDSNLNVHVGFTSWVVNSLGVGAIVNELDGERGAFCVCCVLVQVFFQLIVLSGLLQKLLERSPSHYNRERIRNG